MANLIVLEGPRGVGKTSIAKELVKKLGPGTQYIHHGYGDSTFEIICDEIRKFQDSNDTYVIDRWWLSEYIYALLHRRDTTLWSPTEGQHFPVDLYLAEIMFGDVVRQMGPTIVLKSEVDWIYERWSKMNWRNRLQAALPFGEFTFAARRAEVNGYNMLAPNQWTSFYPLDRTPEDSANFILNTYVKF